MVSGAVETNPTEPLKQPYKMQITLIIWFWDRQE